MGHYWKNVVLYIFLTWILLLGELGGLPPCFGASSFLLVVNEENTYSADLVEMKLVISRLFLKQQLSWPSGELGRPFDRPSQTLEHQHFIKKILRLEEGKLFEHWAKMKQIRGETPPRSIRATRILLKLIGKNRGGFGVIKNEHVENLPKNVRVLFAF